MQPKPSSSERRARDSGRRGAARTRRMRAGESAAARACRRRTARAGCRNQLVEPRAPTRSAALCDMRSPRARRHARVGEEERQHVCAMRPRAQVNGRGGGPCNLGRERMEPGEMPPIRRDGAVGDVANGRRAHGGRRARRRSSGRWVRGEGVVQDDDVAGAIGRRQGGATRAESNRGHGMCAAAHESPAASNTAQGVVPRSLMFATARRRGTTPISRDAREAMVGDLERDRIAPHRRDLEQEPARRLDREPPARRQAVVAM